MFEVTLSHYIFLATTLFVIGLWGVISSRNVIRVLMCAELMLNAVNINLVAFNNYVHPNELSGQVFSIFVLTVSAAEAALGLAIVIALFRSRQTADMEKLNLLKW
jgi:NAD(P)H-quinone oxidoreductase subunit 4L